jgi:hypothetical protein
VEIIDHRHEYTSVLFSLDIKESKDVFENGIAWHGMRLKKCLYRPIMLPRDALRYEFRPMIKKNEIPDKIHNTMKSDFVAYIIHSRRNLTKELGFFVYSYPLSVKFGSGKKESYRIIFGKSALLIHSALRENYNKKTADVSGST